MREIEDDGTPVAPTKRQLTKEDQGWHEDMLEGLDRNGYYSNSKVKTYFDGPRKYYRNYVLGKRSKDTPARELGRIGHSALLEPAKFMEQHAVKPAFSGTGSRAKSKEWDEENADKMVVTQENADKIMYMIDSVLTHKEASRMLNGAVKEANGYVFDERLKVWWLIKPDAFRLTKSGVLISDVKTTANAHPDAFGRDIGNFMYYIQAAIYTDLTEMLTGKKAAPFQFIAVENQEPYTTEVYEIEGDLIEMGRQMYMHAVPKIQELMAAAQKNDNYQPPGYTGAQTVHKIDIKPWQRHQIENNSEFYYGQ